jgi:hypothetical protein
MDGLPAIDLNDITPPVYAIDLQHFCYLATRTLAQAQDLVSGRYALHGAQTQDQWCFWGTIQPPTTEEGEFVLRVETLATGAVHYRMCLHGGPDPLKFMSQCLLYADLMNGNGVWSTLSTGQEDSEDVGYKETLQLSLTTPAGVAVKSLSLLPVNLN